MVTNETKLIETDEPVLIGKFITTDELAEMLGVSIHTIYEWNAVGTGPAYYRVGRFVRYRKADVEAWLAVRRHESRIAS